jgi:hypothetical protein
MQSTNKETIQWQEHFKQYRASGMTQQEYCRQHGLSPGQFSYRFYAGKAGKKPRKVAAAFAQVYLPQAKASLRSGVAGRLVFGSGVTLEIETKTDPVWLARVITAVGGRS